MQDAGGNRGVAAARGAVLLAPHDLARGPRAGGTGRGAEEARPGAAGVDPRDKQLAEQARELSRWQKRAERAEALVEVQKQVAALLGTPLASENS